MRRLLAIVAAGAALAVATGCSSFRSDARAARKAGNSGEGIEGLWEGRWFDRKKTEHGGRLELVLVRTGDMTYRASTRSHWWKVFRSSYDTTLVVTPTAPGQYLIQGGEFLPIWGGFTVTGRVDHARFDAVYRSLGHQGVMELKRAGAP